MVLEARTVLDRERRVGPEARIVPRPLAAPEYAAARAALLHPEATDRAQADLGKRLLPGVARHGAGSISKARLSPVSSKRTCTRPSPAV